MDASSINTSTFTVKQAGVAVAERFLIQVQQPFVPAAVLQQTLYFTATLTTG
jgi:hypothetical protein